MNYSKETTCMFTGHRDIMNIEPEYMLRLAPAIYKAIDLGKTTFLCVHIPHLENTSTAEIEHYHRQK